MHVGKRIWMIGAGAVGGYMAAHMSRSGVELKLIDAWPEHVSEVVHNGLTIEDRDETFSVRFDAALPSGVVGKVAPDVVILACKMHELDDFVNWLERDVGFRGLYIATLNGLADFDLARKVGRDRVIGCIVSGLHAQLANPGHVRRYVARFAERPVFRVGNVACSANERVRCWVRVLANVDTSLAVDDLEGERWTKLQYNGITAALSAVSGLGIRSLCLDEGWRSVMTKLGKEIAETARAHGIELQSICGIDPKLWLVQDSDEDAIGAALVMYGKSMNAAAMSGVAYDLKRGRPTEVNFLNGIVAARAAAVGIHVPSNVRLSNLLVQMEGMKAPLPCAPADLL